MLFAHPIIGLLPIENSFNWFWFAGSIIPDIDHLFIFFKYRLFTWRKIKDSLWFEEKYRIHYKTKYLHSLFGATALSTSIFIISIFTSSQDVNIANAALSQAVYFFLAYLIHLALDWPDKDEKQYFWPLFNKKQKGFLPIFSKLEIVFTLILLFFLFYFYASIPMFLRTLE